MFLCPYWRLQWKPLDFWFCFLIWCGKVEGNVKIGIVHHHHHHFFFFFYHCCKMWGGHSSIFWWRMKPTSDLQSTFLSDHAKNICHSLPRHKIYRFPFMAVSVVCSLQRMLHILKTVCMGLETKEPPKKADMLLLQRLCVYTNVEFSSAVEQQQKCALNLSTAGPPWLLLEMVALKGAIYP